LVGADEWGAVTILHFEVANPGCPFPKNGDTAPPFANMLSTVNGSWSFQLQLNSTFVFRDQGLHIYASIDDSNLTDVFFPHILFSRPFLASLQFISPDGTVAWSYPPSPRTTLTYLHGDWPLDELDVTNKTMSLLQSNQTYTVVARPLLFTQPDQPYPTGLEIRTSLTVC
jgi:hypothetical protein